MTIKVIRSYQPGEPPVEMARFELTSDDRVVATYHNEGLQQTHEAVGIFTSGTGRLKISDGRRFFDALDLAYAHSSFWRVETLPES